MSDRASRPRSRRMPELPVVFEWGGHICFPDGCSGYSYTRENFVNDPYLRDHLRDKRWWTAAHEQALAAELRELEGEDDGHED